jgi:hypothetical protein
MNTKGSFEKASGDLPALCSATNGVWRSMKPQSIK